MMTQASLPELPNVAFNVGIATAIITKHTTQAAGRPTVSSFPPARDLHLPHGPVFGNVP
jgi:hypothetical protein